MSRGIFQLRALFHLTAAVLAPLWQSFPVPSAHCFLPSQDLPHCLSASLLSLLAPWARTDLPHLAFPALWGAPDTGTGLKEVLQQLAGSWGGSVPAEGAAAHPRVRWGWQLRARFGNITPPGEGGGAAQRKGLYGDLGEEKARPLRTVWVLWPAPRGGRPSLAVARAFLGLLSRGRGTAKANMLFLAGILALLPLDHSGATSLFLQPSSPTRTELGLWRRTWSAALVPRAPWWSWKQSSRLGSIRPKAAPLSPRHAERP